jgi:hypothetical protein
MYEGKEKQIHVFGGRIEENRLLVKSRRTWNDNIKIQFKEMDLT